MTTRVIIAIILFGVIFWFYAQLDASIEAVHQHAPEPEKLIRLGKVSMRQIDVLCYELVPQMHPAPSNLKRTLICKYYKQLVPMLFVLASLTGWCASIWLLAFQRQAGAVMESTIAFLASLLLAFVVGVICYLLLIAPFAFFKGDTSRLETAAVFPLLGGLFMRTFFERLPSLLSRIFDIFTGKNKNDKQNKQLKKND